jgi:predicted alpha/beta hydrolase
MKVRTADGWTLDIERRPARTAARAAALLGHAMMVDRRSMDRPSGEGLASLLQARGIEVFLLDFRGHAQSGPGPAEGGTWAYDDLVRFDLPAAVAAVRDTVAGFVPEPTLRAAVRAATFGSKPPVRERGAGAASGLPLVFVGHSLAGHVAMAAAGSGAYACQNACAPPDAHVLLSANTWLPQLEPSAWRRARKAFQVAMFRAIARAAGRFPSRRMRQGPADEALPYCEDLARFWRSGRWDSRDGRHDYLAGMGAVKGPVLAVIGRGDSLLAHRVGAIAWARHLPEPALDLRVTGVGDGSGISWNPDHMGLVTDPRSRPVWEEIARFILARAADPVESPRIAPSQFPAPSPSR